MTVAIGGRLEASDVVAVAGGAPVSFGDDARAKVASARAVIDDAVASGATIYGVTTGFGALAHTRVDPAQASTLQHGIVRSHATAVGAPLPREEARAMLLLRAHVLALGHSGVRPEVVDLMVSMLNEDVIPAVPQQGSLGASGDLAPLANLALPLIGHGEVLAPEGGTEPAAGCDGPRRALAADARGEGRTRPRERHPGDARDRHPGDRARRDARPNRRRRRGDDDRGVARHRPSLRRAAAGAAAASRAGRERCEPSPAARRRRRSSPPTGSRAHLVQDAYSLRCAPQVHGATRDALAYARGVLAIEINSVSDNPIVLPDDGEVVSGGNFHGQPVAVALDTVATALVSLASISERRLYRLLDEHQSNGLPPFLVHGSGLNSGFMLVQYTAASLVSECKSLAHPASVDSIPSSAGQEDHVSMGMTSARHAREVVANAETVLALEALGGRAGARPAGAARARSGDPRGARRRSGLACRSSRPTASSARTSPTP